jgi:hypothetical protein
MAQTSPQLSEKSDDETRALITDQDRLGTHTRQKQAT